MIEVRQLTKAYGPVHAVDDISFDVEQGEIVGFLGPNGAGKTTTMRILTGFHPATAGTAQVAGFDVHKRPLEVKRRVGYLPESVPLYLEMVVSSYLSYVAELKGIGRDQRKKEVADVMERCGLLHMQKRLIQNLSKGYRQRVGLAQALLGNPPVLILDEPTVGLDPKQIVGIRQMIKDLAENHTVLLSTHILPEVSMICKRVLILNQGRIVAERSIDSLSNGSSLNLELRGSAGTIQETLMKVEGVDKTSMQGNRYSVQLSADAKVQEVSPILVRALVGAQIEVVQVQEQSGTLEDVFIDAISQEAEVAHG
ncbi:MAG: ATP-binding cassette domain-containing protein [Candidatus Hydrogenedentota bacterium]